MLRIPFIPTPYPDETLGSLLNRLHLHNGSGLWRCLLEESGYGRRTISQFHLIPVRDTKLEKLLKHLDFSYEEMLHTLSDLPFWLSFNNSCGLYNRISFNNNEGKITKLNTIGRIGAPSGARYCPLCLTDDINAHGETYLHRHHQLPVSLVCAIHGVSLRITCTSCGITVLPFNFALIKSPPLRCQCGQDLRIATPSPPHQKNLQSLSQFAFDTLSCNETPWTAQQIKFVLSKRLGVKINKVNRCSIDLLKTTYGFLESSLSNGHGSLLQNVIEDVPLRLRTVITNFRAPEFCALISATGLTFDGFKKEVNECHLIPRSISTIRKTELPLTIENARIEFERHLGDTLSPTKAFQRLRASSTGHFWVLRLFDSFWLKQQGYSYTLPAIPSINEDRASINRLLAKNGWNTTAISRCGPPVRAFIRDSDWFERRKEEFRSERKINESNSERIQRERAAALSKAIDSVLQTEDRPRIIHSGLISKVAQLSMFQAQITISKDPSLKARISTINLDKDRRTAIWAILKMIESKKEITPKSVLIFAKLITTRANRKLVIHSMEILSSKIKEAHSTIASE